MFGFHDSRNGAPRRGTRDPRTPGGWLDGRLRFSPVSAASLARDYYMRERGTTMIEAKSLTKRYGDRLAVDQLSFSVQPGQVTTPKASATTDPAGKATYISLLAS